MKRQFFGIGIAAIVVLTVVFLGCKNPLDATVKITIQNDSGYKLYSVKAGGVVMGDIDIGTAQRRDIEPDELNYPVFFSVKIGSGNLNIRTADANIYNVNVTVVIDNTTMVILAAGNPPGMTLASLIAAANDKPDEYGVTTGTEDDDDDTEDGLTPGILPQGTLAQKLDLIASRADDGVIYDIPIDSDITHGIDYTGTAGGEVVSTRGRNVVIHIHSSSPGNIKTITLGGKNNLFDIKANITIKLSNIILKGISNNIYPLLYVDSGATLIIEDHALITANNNTKSDTGGSGIQVCDGGILIMNGGEISGNKSSGTNGAGGGVGVMINATFTINGGVISGNEAIKGGGIWVDRYSTIVMNGGEISGNRAENGGGVLIYGEGSFTMNGGTIANNSASDTGGGIYAIDRTLTMNGGGSRIVVTLKGGDITGNRAQYGGGIALYNSRLVKTTGGYIAGTDGGIYANDSTQSQGDAVLYCRDYTFWDRKLSLTQYDAISTDNLNSGWTLLGDEGTF